MLRSYFKTAWIFLLRHKSFSIINIAGLAMGISFCMVIITIVKNQANYDNFHPAPGRTYRINTEVHRTNGSVETYATSPLPLAEKLKSDLPYIQEATTLTGGLSGEAGNTGKTIVVNGFFSDKSFFDVFGFDFLYGSKTTAFNNAHGVIITKKLAEKLFARTDVMGETLSIKGVGAFKVEGVLKEPDGKTHLEFDLLASNANIAASDLNNKILPVTNNWLNFYSSYTYAVLRPGIKEKTVMTDISNICSKQYAGLQLESGDKNIGFDIQPVKSIISGPVLSNNMGRVISSDIFWFLSLIGLLIIASAAFNYTGLMIAMTTDRSKEIGVRKIFGAGKRQLATQFLVQSIVTALLAFVIATFIFHVFLKPYFVGIPFFQNLEISLHEDVSLYIIFLCFSILIGTVSGIFPAIYFSAFTAVEALTSRLDLKRAGKLTYRKVVLCIQFAIAVLFMIGMLNTTRQVRYMYNADYGFSKNTMMDIDLQGNDFQVMKSAYLVTPGVIGVSGNSHSMGTQRDRSIDVRTGVNEERVRVKDFSVDLDYFKNFDLHFLAGRNFYADALGDRDITVVVNEAFLSFFHLGSADEAIGKKILLGDSITTVIGGVLKNFNFQPLTKQIMPVIFRYRPADIAQLNIRLSGTDRQRALTELSNTWKRLDHINTFRGSFLADEMRSVYGPYESIPQLMYIVCFMAVGISMMGLLGVVTFTARQKAREMSIRKILGATSFEVFALFTKVFFKLILAGIAIGLPVAIYLDRLFLNNFAYRVASVPGYVAGIAGLLGMCMIVITSQALKIWIANPVKSLRTE